MDPRNRIDDYSSPWEDYDPTDMDVLDRKSTRLNSSH